MKTTYQELLTDPKFREMTRSELYDSIYYSDTMEYPEYNKIPVSGIECKLDFLLNYYKQNPIMKTTIEELEKELKRVQEINNTQINALSEQIKELKNKPKFEVGKWYKGFDKETRKILIHPIEIDKDGWFSTYGFDINGQWMNPPSRSYNAGYIQATPKEIEDALIKEFYKKGYKRGNFKDVRDGKIVNNWNCDDFTFDLEDNTLWVRGCGYVFDNGKWATIIQEDVIKISTYEVKFDDKHESGMVSRIDGNIFTKDFWQAAKLISEHSKAKIMIGCSQQFDVSLETINAILAKL